ncbi:hypothetical protein TVAG_138330 [Trichomonas vaginalis G3]|uniref:Uncharacterized protein n=1 Tax=Trichomonas vaginalis (strain ATCC PRA-98 / G3) TaxID=412133 RepID=A2ENI6_TRIV3|nr:hypothetical protein TVAGG3_0733340 [Trichomonas vaginalis G3]EAY05764.1 hypothetical protein TVAG_138330 [Trichomonas vaginalis G3]KAI5511418.1 hypothetical protein TVAGG3_0733340 [Trichomonas vaginalis G3]|eukprot:XP_001317987.1 hypothetical protein [Trichomonas vaginalis G3]
MSLKEVFESSPWRSFKKFYEAAKNAGFNDRTEIKRFYDENIVHQVKDEYTVIYEGGVDDKIPSRNLRESNPTHLSELEKDYWKDKNKPKLIKKIL